MEHKKHLIGLTEKQVLESRAKYGRNILSPAKKEPLWKLFLEKFKDPIIRILLIAAFLSLGIAIFEHISDGEGHYAETFGIFCAIFLATGVAFWFERDANKKFDILNQVNDDTLVKVIREGNVIEIPKQDIVVGDTILLETGDEVPADGELIEAVSLQIDESSLTGEPIINKTTNPDDFDEEATYRSNMVMRGTNVMDGHGIFIVQMVGDATEYGKVAEKSTEFTGKETPLNQQLDGLAKFIGFVGLLLAGLTFSVLFLKDIFRGTVVYTPQQLITQGAIIIGLGVALVKIWVPILYGGLELRKKATKLPRSIENGSWIKWLVTGLLTTAIILGVAFLFGVDLFDSRSWISIDTASYILQYFMVAVTLIVVAVPEGLPMSVTLSLALSMRRMLKTNNLVRKMHACETMGAATVICTDKTGTLTQNQMRVHETQFFALKDQKLNDDKISNLVVEGISVNSTAYLDFSDPQKVKTLGNPTEAALLLWLNDNGINYLDYRENTEIVEQLTFSTERKYMATLVKSPLLGKMILYIKGAPEIVMTKCDEVLTNEGTLSIQTEKDAIERQLLQYQNQAMRTLGFACKVIEDGDVNDADIAELAKNDLTFLGIVAIADPVRKDVPAAVAECLEAGIDIKIVTGDTPATAREIGRQIGIWKETDSDENIITGVGFEALSDEEALERVMKLKIMCRARPTDKQRLVELLQQNGAIVAVTGDGTNDAPALNHADVGLSMGTGTSVAKEASDITLLDDSFKSIATAVMWGRSLYKNIQRFLLFQLTINVTALIIVFLGSIFGHDLPLTVTQMLWVNLIMDTFAAGALASLPPDEDVMKEKPRRNKDFIIRPPMRNSILWTGFSFVIILLGMLFYFRTPEALSEFFGHAGDTLKDQKAYFLSFFFTVFVMLQFWNMFNAKAFQTGKSAFKRMHESSGFITVAIIILIGQILIVTFGGSVFRTVPLQIQDWLIIIGVTSLVFWIGEIARFIKKKSA
ncbi:calcium-translocating P-type ATPase, PMCA-type [Dysgonomonas sp. 216]|uniref:calcium-translocating P-type ATPase, PMCA-type n=1 Tax=Dysgonomonas sp. 216 TaxID=2302934 RepID=UPI0013D159A9|nr:calcium-translocating P-type ATPase, PMCA-type [Dysgonomonas sp. 216]NDW19749.1 calcium-translocating P-type ATPase, PMCA-type [Dysgonomonas sp. 216]